MRNVTLDQITLCADGSIGLKFMKQIVDDSDVLMSEPHRSAIDPLGDVAAQMAAVDAHLKAMGYPGVPADAADRVEALKVVHRQHPDVAARIVEITEFRTTALVDANN